MAFIKDGFWSIVNETESVPMKSNAGWNDKIVVLKKTTLQLYFKTFIEKNQFRQLDYVVELTSIQCSRLQPQSLP